MALVNTLSPDELSAAYRPIPYRFTSDLSPESDENPLDEIRLITAAENIAFPELGFDTVILEVDNTSGALGITDGQHIKITGTDDYDGVWRQIVEVATDTIAITAPYTVDETPGSATIEKFYNNFGVVLKVENEGGDEIYRTSTRVGFNFDLKKFLASLLNSELQIGASSDDPALIDVGFLQEANVFWTEQYDIPDSNGINVLTLQDFSLFADDTITAVNSAPKVIGNGYDYNDSLTPFEGSTLLLNKRFLTEQPDVTIGDSDDYQLSFLLDVDIVEIDYKVAFNYFDQSGGFLVTTNNAFIAAATGQRAYSVNVGTRFTPGGILPSAAYYLVTIQRVDTDAEVLGELRFNIDYNCNVEDKRFFWLNNLGGFDAWTFKGHSSEDTKAVSTNIFNANTEKTIDIQNDAEYNKVFTDVQNNRTANSGNVNAETIDWLRGIVKSTQVYMKEDDVLVPVIIDSNSATGSNTRTKKFSLNISYRLAYKELTING